VIKLLMIVAVASETEINGVSFAATWLRIFQVSVPVCLWACHFLWLWSCSYGLKSVLRALKVSVVWCRRFLRR